ncbi:MAG TPA: hypothetical protein VIB39_17480 [Candidatus Angelobacter sp.]
MKHLISRTLPAGLLVALVSLPSWSQTCTTRDDIPQQTRTAVEAAAQQTYDQASRGDVTTLKTNSVAQLQSNFNGIAGAISDNKDAFAGAKPQLRTYFLLDSGETPNPDGTFYCGVYGARGTSSGGAQFAFPGATGKYVVVIQDFVGSKGPYALTTIFQDSGGWKLAGLQIRPESAAGHDGIWYLKQARDYKSKGQAHLAWFYYVTSWELLAPIPSMNTTLLGSILEESNTILPRDIPVGGKPVAYSANGKTYTITDMTTYKTEKALDLLVRYSVPSTSDFNGTQADARSLANALVAQYPEFKTGFSNVWVHAIDPNGGDVVGLVKLR